MGDLSKNFSREEFACRCSCGFDTVDAELLEVLQNLRDFFNKPVNIASGCRCSNHNRNVGGGLHSRHLIARAADITIKFVSPREVQTYLKIKYPNQYGIGSYKQFTHIDTGAKRRWSQDS